MSLEQPISRVQGRFGGKSNRFHTLARIEVATCEVPRLESSILELLNAARVRSLRWSDLDGARERFAAQRLLEFALREMRAGTLRVQVDVQDARSIGRRPEGIEMRATTRDSPSSPLALLAGILAGLVAFSYEKRDEYAAWLRRSGPQCALYSNEIAEFLPSKVTVERFQVLRHFLELCGQHGIAVSMAGARGLTLQSGPKPDADEPFQISYKVD